MITLDALQFRISKIKPISRRTLFRYIAEAGISPIGKQKPRLYPSEAEARILAHLGLGGSRILSLKAAKKGGNK
jgi:hypothetical protein